MAQLHAHFRDADARLASSLHTLFAGTGDMVGGLAQALSDHAQDPEDRGLRITQLKRALRGSTFARGTLRSLRPNVPQQSEELLRTVQQQISEELDRVRSE
jgi:hypothetical protein